MAKKPHQHQSKPATAESTEPASSPDQEPETTPGAEEAADGGPAMAEPDLSIEPAPESPIEFKASEELTEAAAADVQFLPAPELEAAVSEQAGLAAEPAAAEPRPIASLPDLAAVAAE